MILLLVFINLHYQCRRQVLSQLCPSVLFRQWIIYSFHGINYPLFIWDLSSLSYELLFSIFFLPFNLWGNGIIFRPLIHWLNFVILPLWIYLLFISIMPVIKFFIYISHVSFFLLKFSPLITTTFFD